MWLAGNDGMVNPHAGNQRTGGFGAPSILAAARCCAGSQRRGRRRPQDAAVPAQRHEQLVDVELLVRARKLLRPVMG